MADLILKSSYDEDINKYKGAILNLSEKYIQARRYNVRDKIVIEKLSKDLIAERDKGSKAGKIVTTGGNDDVMNRVMKELDFTSDDIEEIHKEAKLLIKNLGC